MAGQFVEIIQPGYSTLWTKDLKYTPGTGEAATLDPFNPRGARPLCEGEWLERASDGVHFTRGGNNALAVPATPDNEATVPSFLYFQEQGRYDAQASKKAHIILGPHGFEFRTKLCRSAGLSVNDRVSVWDWDGDGAYGGLVRRVLAAWVAGLVVGRVSRVFGTNDIAVIYMPGYSA